MSVLLFTAGVLWTAYAIACRAFPNARPSARLTAATVVLFWQLTAAFLLLTALRLFILPVAIVLWIGAALAAHRYARTVVDPVRLAASDLRAIGGWCRALPIVARLIVIGGAAAVGVRVVHGLLAPPLSWDAQTYHLYRPAAWIHAHGFASTAAADASRYYSWFPFYGDLVWAWWLLTMHGDGAVVVIAAGTWLTAALACYACAREIDVPPPRATAAAAALACTPAVLVFSSAPYTDNLALALYLAACVFLARAFRHRDSADAALASAALAVLAGVKGAILFPVCAAGILCALAWAPSPRGRIAVLLCAIPAVVPSVMTMVAMGSPVYPLTVRLGGEVLFPGNHELDRLLRAGWIPNETARQANRLLFGRLFFPWIRLTADFFNLGLGPLVALPALVPGAWSCWRAPVSRVMAGFLLFGALLTVVSILQNDARSLIVVWWAVAGRLVTIAVAAVVLLAAAWRSRISAMLLWAAAAAGLCATWPHGLSSVDVSAAVFMLPRISVLITATWVLGRAIPRARWILRVAALVVAVALIVTARDRFRYQYFAAAAETRAFDLNPLAPNLVSAWPIWQYLDRDRSLTLAVTAGWDGIGHNWYRYPLAGRRLQNRQIYVPVTSQGSLIDYSQITRPAALSCVGWVQRVLESPADYLVVLAPPPPEQQWAAQFPEIFEVEPRAVTPGATLYRINHRARWSSTCR